MFDFKELYELRLKATYNMEINGKTFEEGETIALFDRIQVAGLEEVKSYVTAHGGFDNRDYVFWETTKAINLNFSQGVFSKEIFAILNNSKVIRETEDEPIIISCIENLETNEDCNLTLSHEEYDKVFFYNKITGERITTAYKLGDIWKIPDSPFLDVVVDYKYIYNNGATSYKIGQKLISGFVELEAKTRVKDDTSGQVVTGIIRIPKLKLMSGLSMRLGAKASPMVGNFRAIAEPVDSRTNSYVMEFVILENDIDSDM